MPVTLLKVTEFGYVPVAEFTEVQPAKDALRQLPPAPNPEQAGHRLAEGSQEYWQQLLGATPAVSDFAPGQQVFVTPRDARKAAKGKLNAGVFVTFRSDRKAVVALTKYNVFATVTLDKLFTANDATALTYSE